MPGEPLAATPYALSIGLVTLYTPPRTCEFAAERLDPSADTSLAAYDADGLSGIACTARTAYATQFKGQLRTPAGALQFIAYAANDEQLELAKRILATLRAMD